MTLTPTTHSPVEDPLTPDAGFEDVCALTDLLPERAAAAIVRGAQVALVRLLDDTVYALGQHDPFSDANVMSRGIVGSATVDEEQIPTLQSPMYKQAFDVRTGACLTDPAVSLATWPVLVRDGRVLVGGTASPAAPTPTPTPTTPVVPTAGG